LGLLINYTCLSRIAGQKKLPTVPEIMRDIATLFICNGLIFLRFSMKIAVRNNKKAEPNDPALMCLLVAVRLFIGYD